MVEYGEAEKNEKGGRQEGLPGEIFRVGPSSETIDSERQLRVWRKHGTKQERAGNAFKKGDCLR